MGMLIAVRDEDVVWYDMIWYLRCFRFELVALYVSDRSLCRQTPLLMYG